MQAFGQSPPVQGDSATRIAALSSALAPIFRGKFCDTLLPTRTTRGFDVDEVIYDLGGGTRPGELRKTLLDHGFEVQFASNPGSPLNPQLVIYLLSASEAVWLPAANLSLIAFNDAQLLLQPERPRRNVLRKARHSVLSF